MPEGCSFYDSNRYVWTQDTRKWKPGTNALPMLKLEAQSDPKLADQKKKVIPNCIFLLLYVSLGIQRQV